MIQVSIELPCRDDSFEILARNFCEDTRKITRNLVSLKYRAQFFKTNNALSKTHYIFKCFVHKIVAILFC